MRQRLLTVCPPAAGPQEMVHPVSGRPLVHDWRGDYVSEAVATGHPLVLEILFKQGYKITWQNAQARGAFSAWRLVPCGLGST